MPSDARFSVHSEATHPGREKADVNDTWFATEQPAREEFVRLTRTITRDRGSTEILWLVELRDGDSVIESFDFLQKPDR